VCVCVSVRVCAQAYVFMWVWVCVIKVTCRVEFLGADFCKCVCSYEVFANIVCASPP